MPRRKPRTSRVLFRLFLFGFATSVLADTTRPRAADATRPKLPTPPPPPPVPSRAHRSESNRPEPQRPAPAATTIGVFAGRPAPPRATEWLRRPDPEPVVEAAHERGRRWRVRRAGATIFLSAAFFGGASFSAVAGNEVVKALQSSDSSAQASAVETTASLAGGTESSAQDTQSADASANATQEQVAQPSAQPDQSPAQSDQAPAQADQAPAQVEQTVSVAPSSPAAKPSAPSAAPVQSVHLKESAPASKPAAAAKSKPHEAAPSHRSRVKVVTVHVPAAPSSPVVHRALHPVKSRLDAEAHTPGAAAAVWLNRPALDPTPPSRRLTPQFADQLARTARAHSVDWALVLAVLRADGRTERAPAKRPGLLGLERRLGSLGGRQDSWTAALKLSGDTTFADRTLALERYYSAVGLPALVSGLQAAKPGLEQRVLDDPRLQLYPGGRSDVANHRVDVRVLAMLEYLAETYHEVTVSCLISGHRLYARPGVVSAHIYGRAVDVAALDGIPIAGHQQPGGIVEKAVRSILLLPSEVEPAQVISLLGLGGPSFPLANHWNHIHIGY